MSVPTERRPVCWELWIGGSLLAEYPTEAAAINALAVLGINYRGSYTGHVAINPLYDDETEVTA